MRLLRSARTTCAASPLSDRGLDGLIEGSIGAALCKHDPHAGRGVVHLPRLLSLHGTHDVSVTKPAAQLQQSTSLATARKGAILVCVDWPDLLCPARAPSSIRWYLVLTVLTRYSYTLQIGSLVL